MIPTSPIYDMNNDDIAAKTTPSKVEPKHDNPDPS